MSNARTLLEVARPTRAILGLMRLNFLSVSIEMRS